MITRITHISELASFFPALELLYPTLDGKWDTGASFEEFLATLIKEFTSDSFYFGKLNDDGSICYFTVIFPAPQNKLFCWTLYVNSRFREYSRKWINEMINIIREETSCDSVEFATIRDASSYHRWVSKLGATRKQVIYEIKLK